jgi:hypothetical protein
MSTEQLNFFTRTRRSDPASSLRAEQRMRESGALKGQTLAVHELLKFNPCKTSKELGQIGPLDRYQVARRLADLHRNGRALQIERLKGDCLWYSLISL